MKQPFTSLGLFTYLRTYARRHDETNPSSTVESWDECITRVVNACNTQLHVNFTEEEKNEVYDMLFNLKCSVAGRFLWQLGTRTVDKLGLMSLQNCAFTVVDHPVEPFTWVMNFLMLGAGCGYRISQSDLDKFPDTKSTVISRVDDAGSDYIVPDSRSGWVKLLGKVLKAHFLSGKGFTFSCHNLRSKGAPIKSFGGTASGPDTLCDGIMKIHNILNDRAKNKNSNRLTTVEALDIMNLIGMIVVSGNVRRCLPKGAMVHTDNGLVPIENVMLGTKVLTRKGYYPVTCRFIQGEQDVIDIHTVKGIFTCTLNHKMAYIRNYDLEDVQFCEAGELLYGSVKELVYLSSVEYLTDDQVKKVTYDPVQILSLTYHGKVKTYDIEVDEAHEFFCNGFLTHNSAQIALGDCTDHDYLQAKRWDLGAVPNWRCYSNNSVICNDIEEVLSNDEFWEGYNGNGEPYGLINLNLSRQCGRLGETEFADPDVEGYNPCVAGDTWVFTENGPRMVKDILGEKVKLYVDGQLHETTDDGFYKTGTKQLYELKTSRGYSLRATGNHLIMTSTGEWKAIEDLKAGDTLKLHNHKGIDASEWDTYKETTDYHQTEFIPLSSARLNLAKYYQMLDLCVGIPTTLITHTDYRMLSYYDTSYTTTVMSVTPSTVEDVYDCTVPGISAFDANGFYVHNCAEQSLANRETCCLAEIYLPNIESKEALIKYAKYLYRICKHSLALPCADSEATEQIVHKNMRMGIGVTGYLQATDEQRDWLSDTYTELRKFDQTYSAEHSFPTSVKLTTCKPSGCSREESLILTTKGLLRLNEIGDINGEMWQPVSGLKVFTASGDIRPITKFYVNGEVPTRKIRTQDCVDLESSFNHSYRVLTDTLEYTWKTTGELQQGDRLVVALGDHARNAAVKSDLSPELAYAIGIILNRGICSSSNKFTFLFFHDEQVPERLKSALNQNNIEAQFMDVNFSLNKMYTIDCTTEFYDWMKTNNIIYDIDEVANPLFTGFISRGSKAIPKIIRTASAEAINAFLDAFRTVSVNNNTLASEVVQLARSIGVHGYYNGRDSQFILREDTERNNDRYWNNFRLDPIVFIMDSTCKTYDVEVEEAHHYQLGGVISHNTLSILGACTSGVHPGYAQYYIRRIRVSSDSGLIKVARDHGYPIEYVQNFDGTLDYGTQVISFPMALPSSTVLAENCTAVQQLEWVKKLQTDWSDNSVSCTVYYRKEELPEIKDWLRKNYNSSVKTVSFLLHSEHGFKQAPLEKISKEEYLALAAKCKPIQSVAGICYSEGDEKYVGEGECAGGACPLK